MSLIDLLFVSLLIVRQYRNIFLLVCGSCNAIETKVGLILGRGGKNREMDYGFVKAFFPESDRNIPILIGRTPIFRDFQVVFEDISNKFKLNPI